MGKQNIRKKSFHVKLNFVFFLLRVAVSAAATTKGVEAAKLKSCWNKTDEDIRRGHQKTLLPRRPPLAAKKKEEE